MSKEGTPPSEAARCWTDASPGAGTSCEHATEALRCVCGSLLARWIAEGIELKCRRCKRTRVIAHADIRS